MVDIDVVRVGESRGVVLPEDVLQRLEIGVGDTLGLTEVPEGLLLTRLKIEETEQGRIMRRIAREHREVLKMLADS